MNLFDLFVKIGIDDQVTDKIPGIGNGLKNGLAAAGKAAAVGVGAATTAVAALTKTAVDGYAEYEQLVGGVETLFQRQSLDEFIAANKDAGMSVAELRKEYETIDQASDIVIKNAQEAYKTAGLSANEYMSTITGFSASLLQSLGGDTAAAAEYGNQAVIDMADNANKMGTDISSIQNAYQGFAKQNYTMLDNLKLGYGGTKEEMERLIADANAVKEANGEMGDLSIESFANVVEAIHIMQEEMGIAGATAAEAEGTISGSAAMMKSAWENLVVGLADENANVDELLANFLGAVETTAGNILPVVQRVLISIFSALKENGPEMVASGARLLGELAAGAIKSIPNIVKSIPQIVSAIVGGFKQSAPAFQDIGENIVSGIWKGIQGLGNWIKNKVSGFLGGIVDSAKGVLGIHSPSTVFASMGENMVLGLERGWGDNISTARRDISNDLKFGTASIGYSASAVSRIGGAFGGSLQTGGPMTIVVQSVLDGKVIGESAYQYSKNKARAYGV